MNLEWARSDFRNKSREVNNEELNPAKGSSRENGFQHTLRCPVDFHYHGFDRVPLVFVLLYVWRIYHQNIPSDERCSIRK